MFVEWRMKQALAAFHMYFFEADPFMHANGITLDLEFPVPAVWLHAIGS